jgi:hypothetical protein
LEKEVALEGGALRRVILQELKRGAQKVQEFQQQNQNFR